MIGLRLFDSLTDFVDIMLNVELNMNIISMMISQISLYFVIALMEIEKTDCEESSFVCARFDRKFFQISVSNETENFHKFLISSMQVS